MFKILLTVFLSLFLSNSFAQYFVDFEGEEETKGSYAEGTVILSEKSWTLSESLIGAIAGDKKNGLRSLRMRRSGTTPGLAFMNEDKTNGLGVISFLYARYGTETAQPTLFVEYSINGGDDWLPLGDPITDFPEELTLWSFSLNVEANGRIRFRTDVDGTNERRLNIDDISITDYYGTDPIIFPSVTELSGFNQIIGSPSDSKSFTVLAYNLISPVSLAVTGDYEISVDEVVWNTELTLTETDGAVDELVYVRLNGTDLADPSEGIITLTATDALDKNVQISGVIAEPSTSYIVDFEGENETKGTYAEGVVNLSGLDWSLTQALIGTAANDKKNGARALRLRRTADVNGIAEMLEDKEGGLGVLTFKYARYGTETAQPTLFVEYSMDGGIEWLPLGDPITEYPDELTEWSGTINKEGSGRIRFRVENDGTAERRINIDDIEIPDFIQLPEVITSTTALVDFEQVLANPSAAQSFTVAGLKIADEINLTVSGDFEISLSPDQDYTSALTLLADSDQMVEETTIYVRLNGVDALDPAIGVVSLSATDVDPIEVSLTGLIRNLEPVILSSTLFIDGFFQELPEPSTPQSFQVSAEELTDDLLLEVIGDYEISFESEENYSTSLTILPTNNSIDLTTIFVRLNGAVENVNVLGMIRLSSLNADEVEVDLEGIIVPACEITDQVELNDFVLTAIEDSEEVSFQWIDCDNGFTDIDGATERTFAPEANGNYAVRITASEFCSVTSDCILVAGLNLHQLSIQQVEIYPNPFTAELNISANGKPISFIRVYSAEGKLVYSISSNDKSTTVNTSSWDSGVYLIQLYASGELFTAKVVK